MKPIRWAPQARSDLAEMDGFYREIHPDVAQRMVQRAVAAANLLSENPRLGTAIQETRRRKWLVPKTSYVLIYREAADHLRILRVINAARDWQRFI